MAFVELSEADGASTEERTLTVHMAGGTYRTVRGDGDAEAFAQALDEHAGINSS